MDRPRKTVSSDKMDHGWQSKSSEQTRTETSPERERRFMKFSSSVTRDVPSNSNQDQQNHPSQHTSCIELNRISERVQLEVDKKSVTSNSSNILKKHNIYRDEFDEALGKALLEYNREQFNVPQYVRQRERQRDLQRATIQQTKFIGRRMMLHLLEYESDPQKKKQVYELMIHPELSRASENARQSLSLPEPFIPISQERGIRIKLSKDEVSK